MSSPALRENPSADVIPLTPSQQLVAKTIDDIDAGALIENTIQLIERKIKLNIPDRTLSIEEIEALRTASFEAIRSLRTKIIIQTTEKTQTGALSVLVESVVNKVQTSYYMQNIAPTPPEESSKSFTKNPLSLREKLCEKISYWRNKQ